MKQHTRGILSIYSLKQFITLEKNYGGAGAETGGRWEMTQKLGA